MNLDALHARLVAGLDTTDAISAAFADRPRHHYVPDLIWPDATGLPLYRTADPDRWGSVVYSDDAVTTQANDGGSGTVNVPSSSSSAPQVMADMIAAAEIGPGTRVLEIGTGTGWNAAILSSLVGPTGHVTSVEIDPGVAAHARSRLAGTGVRVTTDTRLSGSDTYDAVLATCSVHRVPPEWIARVEPGAPVVLPWAPYPEGGPTPIVALRKTGEHSAAGPFVRDGAFMRDRTQRLPRERFPGTGADPTGKGRFPVGSVDLIENNLLTRLVLLCPEMRITVGGRPWQDANAPIVALGSADSWAHIWPDGSVTSDDRASLVERLTAAYQGFQDAHRPELAEFTLEADLAGGVYRVRTPFGSWEHLA